MSYDSQRGGLTGLSGVETPKDDQKDCDGPGPVAGCMQGQDAPLLSVGTYSRPDGSIDSSIFTSDQQKVKKAGGTVGGALRTVGLT